MATGQTFSGGQRKPQGSPGTELPQPVPRQGALAGSQDGDQETWHVSFRAFTSSEHSDPLDDLRRLRELCYLWLRPDLHTKEQILDALVMEQFLISMPQELQVLVKESGVRSCKDLQDLLRSHQAPKKWTIVTFQGQEFLVHSSDAQLAGAGVSDVDRVTDLSKKPASSVREAGPEDGREVRSQLQNLPEVRRPSGAQESVTPSPKGQGAVLPEALPGRGVQEGLRPKGPSKKNLMGDPEEKTALKSQAPQLLEGPADPVRAQCGEARPAGARVTSGGAPKSPGDPQGGKPDPTSTSEAVPAQGAPSAGRGDVSAQPASRPVPPAGDDAPGRTPTVCSVCEKGFQYKSQLHTHWRTHTGERPFRCDLCAGAFLQPSDLRVHRRVHTGDKPYSCELCRKTFGHDSTLRAHRRVHTREKPYPCEDCGKAFSHRGNLNVHRRTHSGLKPYTCPECRCDFRQLGTLKRHQKTHAK